MTAAVYFASGADWIIVPRRKASEALAHPERPFYGLHIAADGSEHVRAYSIFAKIPGTRTPEYRVPERIRGII